MKRLWILIIILISISCREKSLYKNDEENKTAVIIPKETVIEDLRIIKWMVGSGFKYEVSKGFRFKVALPLLEHEDLLDVARKKGANAWLFKISKRTQVRNEVLGHVYIPLLIPGRGNNRLRVRQLKNATFDVFYQAASMSRRFESFQCPAFGHSKVVTDYILHDSLEPVSEITLGRRQDDPVEAKVYDFGLSPTVFNGGEDLIGTYVVDMALYNVEQKVRKSNFVQLRQTIEVKKEGIARVRGCENFQIPKKEPDVDKRKQFKFGQ